MLIRLSNGKTFEIHYGPVNPKFLAAKKHEREAKSTNDRKVTGKRSARRGDAQKA